MAKKKPTTSDQSSASTSKRERTEKNPLGAGRKLIPIDWDTFDKLCLIQATLAEIAAFIGCSEDTIERACVRELGVKFAEAWAQRAVKGKISVRRAMYQRAVAGNTSLLIFWAKNHLGMADSLINVHEFESKRAKSMSDEELKEEAMKLMEREGE